MQLTDEVIPRYLESVAIERMAWSPVVVISGARTSGKSTVLASIARQHGVKVIDLDQVPVRELINQDVPGFLGSADRPVCIDEFQHNLEILDAIKADLNRGTSPGGYVLTGSTRYSTLPRTSQSLTGRAHIMTLWPFSQGELRGHRETFLDRIINEPGTLAKPSQTQLTRSEYEEIILAGGFPLALDVPAGTPREAWFADFINLVVRRDILELRQIRQRRLLGEVLRHVAAQTAQVFDANRIATATGISAQFAGDFVSLLESVFITHRLDAYGRTLGAKVRRRPKVHLVDTGLGAHLLGVTLGKLRSIQPGALTEFGHLTETFAVNELMKQAGWAQTNVTFAHFRSGDKHEVDLVIEANDGRVAAVEIKAGSKVTDADFAGMRMLRDKLGTDFVSGVLLNLGQLAYRYDDRLFVQPLERLWTPIDS